MSLRKRRKEPSTWWSSLKRLALCCSNDAPRRRVTWDEANISVHLAQRGVLYGTQEIPEQPTPFLVYDSKMSRADHAIIEVGAQHEKVAVNITELQAKLGMIEQEQDNGCEVVPTATRNLAFVDDNARREAIAAENKRRREAGAVLKSQRLECSEGAAMAFKAKVGADGVGGCSGKDA
mmetsp:Transcript_32577/g.89888  ORF Transcript_32577/g.89888 Transcript_32577/m.89888 type:complete len:178 (+) Transcript_32577:61-594(+)|eukprot:CAMPEP_0117538200 /NCGR_PEP_ID=MMETSP0784-20121206/42358_1 /TAXON_ID=39447 /ORGANISM="" /LENGTH=177 /DNA_ID=CAMNT_0005334811 /DNA_START=57 /DNA_END=590 /DNA_ORIENTATION=+